MWKRLTMLWVLVRGDARRLWFALRHPLAPGWLKLAVAGLVLYLLSPADLIPDVIPFFGVVDDLVLLPLAVRWLLGQLPPALKQAMDRHFGAEADRGPGPAR